MENYIRNWCDQGRHKFQPGEQRLGTAAGSIVSLTHRITSIDSLTIALFLDSKGPCFLPVHNRLCIFFLHYNVNVVQLKQGNY